MTLNDQELCRYRAVIRNAHKLLDEVTANGKGAELDKLYQQIELAAKLAQDRLREIK